MFEAPTPRSKKLFETEKKILQAHESKLYTSLSFIKQTKLYRENFDSFSDYVNSLENKISDFKDGTVDPNSNIKLLSFLDTIKYIAFTNKSEYFSVAECLKIYLDEPSAYKEPFWQVCRDIGERWNENYVTIFFQNWVFPEEVDNA